MDHPLRAASAPPTTSAPAIAAAPPASSRAATDQLIAELTGLADLSARLAALNDEDGILSALCERLADVFSVDLVAVLRLEGDELVTVASNAPPDARVPVRIRPASSPTLRRVLESRSAAVVSDLRQGIHAAPELIARMGLRSAMYVPIPDGPTGIANWGVLTLLTQKPRRFTQLELERLAAVAGQTGLALSNARLVAESRRWTGHLEGIEALARQLNRGRDVKTVAALLAQEIESLIRWDGLRFYVLQPDGVTLEAVALLAKVPEYADESPEDVRLCVGEGLGGKIAQSGVSEIIPDVLRDPRMVEIPGSDDLEESMMVVPLVFEDRILGVVELSRLGLDRFDAYDLRLAQILAAQAAVALVNAGHVEELERRSARLERQLTSQRQLLRVTERLLKTGDRDAIFSAIADTLAEVVPYDAFAILFADRPADRIVALFARDPYADDIVGSSFPLGTGITGDVIRRGEAELIQDTSRDPRALVVPGTPEDARESLIVSPLRGPLGVIGSLNVYRVGRQFDEEDLALTTLFANQAAIALDNAQVHEQLVAAARTDPLTGLPNRALFRSRVEHALGRRRRVPEAVAVLFLDLDDFKTINDSLGHAAGDEVLKVLATRLADCMAAGDTVARLGGDEFGVLLGAASAQDPAAEAKRIAGVLREPVPADGRTVTVDVSIGVAVRELPAGDHSSPELYRVGADELLRDADVAMYRAKAAGKGRSVLFEPGMHQAAVARLDLEVALRDALSTRAFRLLYQPVVDLQTRRVRSVEALLRWDHPVLGPMEPSAFVPAAEEMGLIRPIGRWVLGEACRQVQEWHAAGEVDEELGVTVNVSVRQLADSAFLEEVRTALAESGLPARLLTLEITESALLDHQGFAIVTLRTLHGMGVRVAVDDFGTGYSSLSSVKVLPVDALKIDRSFIEGLGSDRDDTGIVSAIVAFADALGLAVTAEGIEREEQVDALVAIGCEYGQGYLFGSAMEAAQAASFSIGSGQAAARR